MRAEDINYASPIIRQTRFYLKGERVYTFDVNQTITINKLKRMIITAANLGKIGLRLFSNSIEYTDKDDSMLETLFPNQQLVEFTYEIYQIEESDKHFISLKFKDYCPEHTGKYPYFYCYDCSKSVCSICVKLPKHIGHNIKEKYDYLQRSRTLIEELFSNLNTLLAEGRDIKSLDDLKFKISEDFSKLILKIKLIEQRFISLVNEFINKKAKNFDTLRTNVELLKNYCAKGLDELKKILDIKKLIVDENVFLNIDIKLKELKKEENKFAEDVISFKEFCEIYKKITLQSKKIYSGIDDCLDQFIREDSTKEINDKITSFSIKKVSKAQINHSLLSNLRSSKGKEGKDFSGIEVPSYKSRFKEENEQYEGKIQYVGKILQGNSKILVYNSVEGKIQSLTIDFSHFNCISNFLNNCAWVNHNDRLYFSGGLEKNVGSKTFFVYNFRSNSLKRLRDMSYGHYCHSMLVHDDILYVIGGKSTQCEKYNLETNSWSDMNGLIFEQQHPVLYPYQNFLYSFFGLDMNGKYIDTIQKINITRENSKWEFVSYLRNDCSLEMYGCGIVKDDSKEGAIYFIGGKDASIVRQTTIEFNFKDLTCQRVLRSIDSEAYFKDSIISSIH